MTMGIKNDIRSFWSKVRINENTKCWDWVTGKDNYGYGQFHVQGKMYKTHRLSYEYLVGQIPKGLQLDHLCRNRGCVNPEHLELVTNKENVLRGIGITAQNKKKTHCIRGHEYTDKNTRIKKTGGRACRKCDLIHCYNYQEKLRICSQ